MARKTAIMAGNVAPPPGTSAERYVTQVYGVMITFQLFGIINSLTIGKMKK